MASHDSYKQLNTIADALLDVGKRLTNAGRAEAEEVVRLARALQIEITFVVPSAPVSTQDAVMQRWFSECCTRSGRYLTSGEDAGAAFDLWLKENSLDRPYVEAPPEIASQVGSGRDWHPTDAWREWQNVHNGLGAWIHENFPPNPTGNSVDPFIFPFALNDRVVRQLAEHRGRESAEESARQKERSDREAENVKLLSPWFSKFKTTLPDRIERTAVNAAAIKALKGEKLRHGVVSQMMIEAGFGLDKSRKVWERKMPSNE